MNYQQGDTVYFNLQHKTYTLLTDVWALADADTNYPKITITDSEGTVIINAVSMTNKATGKYEYLYQLASDAPTGTWTGFIETSNSAYLDKQYFAFEVE